LFRLNRPFISVFFWMATAALSATAAAQVTVDISHPSVQHSRPRPNAAEIRNIAVVPSAQGVSLEIFSSRPVVPQITKLDSPPRLVLDILDSVPALTTSQIPVNRGDVRMIRIGRFQQNPPITRVVIDLDHEMNYGMVAAGTQFTLELHPMTAAAGAQQAAAQQTNPNDVPPAAPYYSPMESANRQQPPAPQRQQPPIQQIQPPVAQPAVVVPDVLPTARPASASSGDVGTSLSAGADTAVMHLARGGELRVCPGTTLSVTPTRNGQELMLGVSTGSFEVHYALASGSDTIVTPDFRMQLIGPGLFEFAFSADTRGNTCVRSLPSNQGAVMISEVMGDGVYTVRPNESVEFRGGRISARDQVSPACGCPASGVPIMRAENKVPTESPAPISSVEPPHPAPIPGEAAVSVEAPLVFRGGDPQQETAPPDTAKLAMQPDEQRAPLQASPPPAQPAAAGYKASDKKPQPQPTEKKGFFAKVRGFFSGIFH